jgi:hypothetical protein
MCVEALASAPIHHLKVTFSPPKKKREIKRERERRNNTKGHQFRGELNWLRLVVA